MIGTFLKKYVPTSLSQKDQRRQATEIQRSRRAYSRQRLPLRFAPRTYRRLRFHNRPKMKSFRSKPSPHVVKAQRLYHVDKIGATPALAKASGCKRSALAAIIRKGAGAYYSSGSRPNQTAQSWGKARLASALTAGKAAVVDYHILKRGCHPKTSKALRLANQAKSRKFRRPSRRFITL